MKILTRAVLLLLMMLLPGLLYGQRVNNLVPNFSPSTASPYTITVNGDGFTPGATVLWESIPLSTTYVSAYQLTALVPCCFSVDVSTVHIIVQLSGGQTSIPVLFQNLGAQAPITSTVPSTFTAGVTTPLTVNGNYFVAGSTITFDNIPQTTTMVSQFQMTATVPGGNIDSRTNHVIKVHYPKNPSVRLNPQTLSFGTINTGTTSTLDSTLSNLASTTLTISSKVKSGAAEFSFTDTCSSTVAPSASCVFHVQFAPLSVGTFAGQIAVTDTGVGSPHIISFSGAGTGPPPGNVLLFSPSSLTFPTTATGGSSSPQTITVTNSGASTVTISGVALTGTGLGSYSIADSCTGTLASLASCNVDVTFTPLSAGILTAAVQFTDTGVGSPQNVPVTGTGSTASHSVDVAWTASASSGVTGYNVYRGTVSGGPYTQINGALISGTTYTDFAVTSGQNYCYVVTAFAPTGYSPQESVHSIESCATVP
jgi:hypothetical protein